MNLFSLPFSINQTIHLILIEMTIVQIAVLQSESYTMVPPQMKSRWLNNLFLSDNFKRFLIEMKIVQIAVLQFESRTPVLPQTKNGDMGNFGSIKTINLLLFPYTRLYECRF